MRLRWYAERWRSIGAFALPDHHHVHPLFLDRDITRHDIREMVKRALRETKGNYRAVLRLLGMPDSDYHRFHNFLTAHACKVDFRNYRTGVDVPSARPVAIFKVS